MSYGLAIQGVTAVAGRVSPKVASTALAYVNKAGSRAFGSLQDAVNWAKSSPAGAFLLASGLIEAGVSISELFGSDVEKIAADPRTSNAMAKLKEQASALGAVQKVLDDQADVKLNLGSRADAALAGAMVQNLRSVFGSSKDRIREMHLSMRMFQEMSGDQLDHILDVYWDYRPANKVM